MPCRAAVFLLVLAVAAFVNEAITLGKLLRSQRVDRTLMGIRQGVTVREASKAEIMSTMTVDRAYKAFMAMKHSKLDARAVTMIQKKFGDSDEQDKSEPTGYAAVDTARDMLNEMMDEAVMNKELEGIRCSEYETKQTKMIGSLEHDIVYANSEASAAKSEVLRTTEVIQVIEEVQLPKYREELREHKERCKVDIAALQAQLRIVMADEAVMKRILDMVCADDVRTTVPPGGSFLQLGASSQEGSIVKCISCMSGQQMAWFKHNKIQPMLATVTSSVAKEYIQENLLSEFDEQERRRPTRVSTVLLQREEIVQEVQNIPGIEIAGLNQSMPAPGSGPCNEQIIGDNTSSYRGCQAETISGKTCQKWTIQAPQEHTRTAENYPNLGLGDHNYCRNPDNEETLWCYTTDPNVRWEACEPMVDLKVPNGVAKHECVETDMCKLSKPDCGKLRDRFLVIMAGIQDKRMELSDQLDTLQDSCQKTAIQYEEIISSRESQLKEEQTNFAAATKSLQENQQLSTTSNEQHGELGLDYHSTMSTCCDNKNGFTSEICALEKIRGELYRLEGVEALITDCEVSAWTDEECSVSCSGGDQDRTRSIIIHPINGTACPPLKMQRSCNTEGCPVDCQVGEWSEWSDCTAECGGGVKSRSRDKTVEPENGGDPCPEQSETRECNGLSCNADCVLADWDSWSLCSKACYQGNEQRRKKVLTDVRGQGVCPGDDDKERLAFHNCNDFDCRDLLPRGRNVLKCSAMVDLIILLDGSGSLGWYGWKQSKKMALKLIRQMIGGENNVNMALLLFSGPNSWRKMDACTGADPLAAAPPPRQCGMFWISHMTADMSGVQRKASKMSWPGKTTLTSLALAEAKSELLQGRQDAQSVVVVITDGKPMSPIKTGHASRQIKDTARLMFIPVGKGIKKTIPKMKTWCSMPYVDNVLTIDTFSALSSPSSLNKMISGFCNVVE